MNRALPFVVSTAVLLPACFQVHPVALPDAAAGSGGAGTTVVGSGGAGGGDPAGSGGAGVEPGDGSASDLVVIGTGGAASGTGGALGTGGAGGAPGSGGRGTGGAVGTGGRSGTGGRGTGGMGTGGQVVTTPFHEDFEDGDYAGWILSDTTDPVAVTTTTAANGTARSFTMTESGSSGNWIERDIGPRFPSSVSWWGRAGQNDKRVGTFSLRHDDHHLSVPFLAVNFGNTTIGFDAGLGRIVEPYTANRWYHFEVRNIDWTTRRYDYYIDGVLQRAAIPFNSGRASTVRYIDFSSAPDVGGVAYWDEIDIR